MAKFKRVLMYSVNPATLEAVEVGWAVSCVTMLRTAYPRITSDVYNLPEIRAMMDRVDNETGTLYVCVIGEKKPLLANSSYDKIREEILDVL